MFAYVLVLLAVASRYLVAGHLPLLNFTAVTGSLVYFGARRSWREMLAPLAILMASDFALTAYVYHYQFHWQAYVTTWAWYAAAIALAFVRPWVAIVLYMAVAIAWFLPDRRIESLKDT